MPRRFSLGGRRAARAGRRDGGGRRAPVARISPAARLGKVRGGGGSILSGSVLAFPLQSWDALFFFPLLVSVSESVLTVVVKCQGNFAFATDSVPAGGGNGGELVGERCLFPFFFGRVEWVGARESLISRAFCCTSGHQIFFVLYLLMNRFAVRTGSYFSRHLVNLSLFPFCS